MIRRPDRPRLPEAGPPPELRLLVERGGRDALRVGHRLIIPRRAAGGGLFGILLRAGLGSLALALALGIFFGRATVGGEAPPPEVRISGAGHLASAWAGAAVGAEGALGDVAAIRERFLATGIPEEVVVKRALPGAVRVEVVEKRAVALLSGEPLAALAADGTVLGPASVADFRWAGASDLVLVRGADRSAPDFAGRAALAGRLATALRGRPELDRLVSELRVEAGPLRIGVALRSPELVVLVTEADFLDRLALVAGLLPDLAARWPDLSRIDARVPDRLLVRSGPPPAPDAGSPQGEPSP